jgi:hypothetical protein
MQKLTILEDTRAPPGEIFSGGDVLFEGLCGMV